MDEGLEAALGHSKHHYLQRAGIAFVPGYVGIYWQGMPSLRSPRLCLKPCSWLGLLFTWGRGVCLEAEAWVSTQQNTDHLAYVQD